MRLMGCVLRNGSLGEEVGESSAQNIFCNNFFRNQTLAFCKEFGRLLDICFHILESKSALLLLFDRQNLELFARAKKRRRAF